MATGPDDVRFQGKTGTHGQIVKPTRLTQNGPRACFGLGAEIKILATGRLVESRGADC
jgi:hypothetical protein